MNSNFSDSSIFQFFFIKPVFSILLLMILMVGGYMGFSSMIKENYPDLEIPQAIITTEWEGAPPEIVEKEISDKIEKEIKSIKGLKRYKSGSRESASVIAVEFYADASMDESMQLLRAKLNNAEAELPKEAEKPKIEQVSVNNTPIVTFAIYGDMDHRILGDAARKLEKRLERIPGIRKVDLSGERKEIIRVDLIPQRIKALGISPTIIQERLISVNRDFPWGNFENPDFAFSLQIEGAFRHLKEIKNLPVARIPGGRVIRLSEVAEITRDIEKEAVATEFSWKGGEFKKAVVLSVFKVPGRDTMAIIDKASEFMESARTTDIWPWSMEYKIISDESEQIMDALMSVFNNGWQAMLIVSFILLFLLTWREAVIAGLSIPITFMGSFGIIMLLGYTLNQMVIIGMVLALGMLVDVFILVMEGMHDAIYVKKLSFREAAARTIQSYAMPAFAGQLTTILAMVPLLVIQGIDGKFIRVIPVTTIICLLVSYILAFVIDIPISRFLLGTKKEKPKRTAIDRLTEKIQKKFGAWMMKSPLSGKKRAGSWLVGTIFLFLISIISTGYLPQILYPKDDGRNLGITVELEPGVQLEDSKKVGDIVGELLLDYPYLKNVTRYVGERSAFTTNSIAELLVVNRASYIIGFSCLFTKKEERDKLAYQYVEELRRDIKKALSNIPGARVFIVVEEGGSSTEDPVQIDITGDDMDRLRVISQEVQKKLELVPGTLNVRDNIGAAKVEITTYPLREALDFYGVDQQDMNNQMRIWMANDDTGDFRMPGIEDDLEIQLGTKWKGRKGSIGGPVEEEELDRITIITRDGRNIPLKSLVNYKIDQASQVIPRKNGYRSVTVSSKVENTTVNEIVSRITPELEELKKTWPSGYDYSFAGEKENADQTFNSVGQVFILALFMVFAVLAILFGSFSQSAIIMFTVPFAMIGVFGGFFLAGIPFSFLATIGIVTLVGIVVNNAIIMVETMNTHIKSGLLVEEAAAKGAADRLRPIFGTTLTTTAGLIPLALSSPMWMPLCLAIIFGLIASTMVSLVLVPCLFLLFSKTEKKSPGELRIQ